MSLIDEAEKKSNLELNIQQVSNDTYLKVHDVKQSLVNKDMAVLENKLDYVYQNKNFFFGLTPSFYEDTTKIGHKRHVYLLP